MLTQDQRRNCIDKIRGLPSQVKDLVNGLSDEQLTTKSLATEWTIAQIAHHLADSHMNSFIRLKLLLTEDHPPLKPYDQEAWATMADEVGLPIQPSLMLLQGLHQRWVTVFESLSEAEWHRTAYHPEIGDITADDLLRIYAAHGEDHLNQMKRVLAAQGDQEDASY